MPTTHDEAKMIIDTIDKYIPRDKARELICELRDKVGRVSDNTSVMVTMEMLAMAYGELPDPKVLEICMRDYGCVALTPQKE